MSWFSPAFCQRDIHAGGFSQRCKRAGFLSYYFVERTYTQPLLTTESGRLE